MVKSKGYKPQRINVDQEITDLWTNFVYVSYRAEWEGLLIEDHFLWPRVNRSVYEMKVFAVAFLSDLLVEDFRKYECH